MIHTQRTVFQAILFSIASLFAFTATAAVTAKQEAEILERISPVGKVSVATAAAAAPAGAAPAAAADGGTVYQSACFACHGTGAAGAPKYGDKAAWAPRISQGMDTLNDHAINGFKGMPPKGGQAALSDDAVKAAVKHMVDNSQ